MSLLKKSGTNRSISFSPPDITEEEVREVADTLLSGWITTGPKTKEFERQIASFCHTERAVCLNSSTAAMEMTLRLLGVGPGDEVITTAYTYTATASAICHTGATPVLVDVKKDSYEMDLAAVEKAITERTKVIVPVDIAGVMVDYDGIYQVIGKKKELYHAGENKYQKLFDRIIVMADSAHGFGAVRQGKMSGEFADFTTFSFHAVKNLTTAEGGAVTWRSVPGMDNEEVYKEYMLLSLHGQSKDALAKTKPGAWEYDILFPAYKCNMTDIMASIGLVQLRRYPELLARRREIIETYDRGIQQINERLHRYHLHALCHYEEEKISSGHLYLLRVDGADVETRNRLIELMAEKGVATNVHYKPLPLLTAYKNLGFSIEDYPNAYEMYANEVTLPVHTGLSEKDTAYVLQKLEETMLQIENGEYHA